MDYMELMDLIFMLIVSVLLLGIIFILFDLIGG
jgi:hypothetical protein